MVILQDDSVPVYEAGHRCEQTQGDYCEGYLRPCSPHAETLQTQPHISGELVKKSYHISVEVAKIAYQIYQVSL